MHKARQVRSLLQNHGQLGTLQSCTTAWLSLCSARNWNTRFQFIFWSETTQQEQVNACPGWAFLLACCGQAGDSRQEESRSSPRTGHSLLQWLLCKPCWTSRVCFFQLSDIKCIKALAAGTRPMVWGKLQISEISSCKPVFRREPSSRWVQFVVSQCLEELMQIVLHMFNHGCSGEGSDM